MLCIIQALCNLNPRVLATLEAYTLFQRQNVVEKTQVLLQAKNNTKHAKQESISAADFITDGIF